MFDLYNVGSLATAAEKNLVKKERNLDKEAMRQVYDQTTTKYNEEEFMLTPCRFAPGGWKYVRRTSINKYLNHPNKANNLGMGPQKMNLMEGAPLTNSATRKEASPRQDSCSLSPGRSLSDIKTHYQRQFDDKQQQHHILNIVKFKEVRQREKQKEYKYPPLPNIQSVKKAFLKQNQDSRAI